jgi:drug/metabolite transporter (DMT)-like permease
MMRTVKEPGAAIGEEQEIPILMSRTLEVDEGESDSFSSSYSSSVKVPSAAILGMPPKAILALNFVAVIWGTQHAVIKMVVVDSEAGPFTLLRFGIGAMVATIPLLFQNSNKEQSAMSLNVSSEGTRTSEHPGLEKSLSQTDDNLTTTVVRWGLEMGWWLFLGFAFQAIGLATTTAQRSGFLLYLNVKFVPFFAFLLFGRHISLPTWVSAITAFAGTALLAYDGTSWSLNEGDLWSMAAAAASAMYILRLDSASKAVGDNNSAQLNAVCLWTVTFFSAIWSMVESSESMGTATVNTLQQLIHIATSHPLELIYLSAVTTALANYIQTKSQKDISAERASVIYAMDPVYGAVFSNLLLGETLTSLGLVGAGMITVAAATNAFLDLGTAGTSEKPNDKTQ